jgi:Flagellar motor switch/type III secretory pathway protein
MSIVAQSTNPNSDAYQVIDAKPVQVEPIDTMGWLPCTLTVEVPVARFTIADLLNLRVGAIVETACRHTSDVPLRVNRMLIGWTEFDVVGDRLAIRVTEQI